MWTIKQSWVTKWYRVQKILNICSIIHLKVTLKRNKIIVFEKVRQDIFYFHVSIKYENRLKSE